MRRLGVLLLLAAAALALYVASFSEDEYRRVEIKVVDHTKDFLEEGITAYEGAKTCYKCHEQATLDFFHSYHYQMVARQYDVVNAPWVPYGGKVAMNDFCGAIFYNGKPINFIGFAKLTNPPPGYEHLRGKPVAFGCAACHGIGLGEVPQTRLTDAQLKNMDCLACHVRPEVYVGGVIGFKKGVREIYKDENGNWRYKVNLDVMTIAKNIINKPTRANCLACHAYSGGGPGFKRPNITPDLYNPSKYFDYHMGEGMHCVDCHTGKYHLFPDRAADGWAREPGEVKTCVDCHGPRPHEDEYGDDLNKHSEFLACQTCHIPYIAHGQYPTELSRDWGGSRFSPELGYYEPLARYGKYVRPTYMWYNGTRSIYVYPSKVEGEVVVTVKPLGGRGNGKIYPFKLHTSRVPLSEEGIPIPIKVGLFMATGDSNKAILAGAAAAGLTWNGKWVTYVRYMQVDHGVLPDDRALGCKECHSPNTFFPWKELGYDRIILLDGR
ncbi:MAG: hypothetical protein GXO07_03205 [Crenarchaeota archaeon]|nr:hypothetical protein [Thermoproteota archaeon]